jgi:hypothetical protein
MSDLTRFRRCWNAELVWVACWRPLWPAVRKWTIWDFLFVDWLVVCMEHYCTVRATLCMFIPITYTNTCTHYYLNWSLWIFNGRSSSKVLIIYDEHHMTMRTGLPLFSRAYAETSETRLPIGLYWSFYSEVSNSTLFHQLLITTPTVGCSTIFSVNRPIACDVTGRVQWAALEDNWHRSLWRKCTEAAFAARLQRK